MHTTMSNAGGFVVVVIAFRSLPIGNPLFPNNYFQQASQNVFKSTPASASVSIPSISCCQVSTPVTQSGDVTSRHVTVS